MKFLTLVIMIVGIIILFNAAGITTNSGSITKYLLDNGISAFATSELWTKLLLVLAGASTVGAVASLFGRVPDISWILAGVVSLFGGAVLADMLGLYLKITFYGVAWMNSVFFLIFALLLYGFLISLISFWRGTDG